MPRVHGGITDVGPRSAHIAGLPYAAFADPDEMAGCELVFVKPLPADPEDYAAVRTRSGQTYAITNNHFRGQALVNAMEIIEELEGVRRGVYGGAVGYLSFAGDMDVAIAIRTGVIKDQTLYVQAGAGVVADSVPELEWKETEAKARAVIRAAEMVEQGF